VLDAHVLLYFGLGVNMKGHSEEGADDGIPTEAMKKSWARYAACMGKKNSYTTLYSIFFFPWKCDTLSTLPG
jgi:hypothetical protein